MALEGAKESRLEVIRDAKDTKNSLVRAKNELGGTPTKLRVERRVGASRVLCNLPTIEEQQVDDETIDVLSRLEKHVGKVNHIVTRAKQGKKEPSSRRLDYNSDNQRVEKQLSSEQSGGQPVCQSE